MRLNYKENERKLIISCTKCNERFKPVKFETIKFDNFYCAQNSFIKIKLKYWLYLNINYEKKFYLIFYLKIFLVIYVDHASLCVKFNRGKILLLPIFNCSPHKCLCVFKGNAYE